MLPIYKSTIFRQHLISNRKQIQFNNNSEDTSVDFPQVFDLSCSSMTLFYLDVLIFQSHYYTYDGYEELRIPIQISLSTGI